MPPRIYARGIKDHHTDPCRLDSRRPTERSILHQTLNVRDAVYAPGINDGAAPERQANRAIRRNALLTDSLPFGGSRS